MPAWLPKNRPFAQDHWGDVHRDLVDQPRRERLTAEVAGGHANETVAREVRGGRDARLDGAGGLKRCVLMVGEPLLRQGPVGDDDQLVPGGRLAVPAVGGVEHVSADHRHIDGVPEGLNVVRGRPRDMEGPAARACGHLGVAVEVPVEQWSDRVVRTGDVAVPCPSG